MMTPEVKSEWLRALRSGDYQQGKATLRGPNGFCCLGVLCDVVNPNAWVPANVPQAGMYRWYGERTILPEDFKVAAGVDDDAESELVNMNDHEDRNFDEIADWIENNL
jgi:hypothetical protein